MKHSFFDKHTILGAIILAVLNEILYLLFQPVGALVLGEDYASYACVLGGILILVFFALFFKKEFIGFFKGNDTKTAFKLAAFMLIYYAYLNIQTAVWGEFCMPTLKGLGNSLMAGICEEAVFRGAVLSYLMRQWKDSKKVVPAVIFSSILFASIHLLNITSGAGLGITILQFFGAIGMGSMFAAIYVRSGNIFVAMLAHGLTDFICFLDKTQISDDGVMITDVKFFNFIDIGICMVLLVIAIYLLRPAKWPEIKAVWDKKWSRQLKDS